MLWSESNIIFAVIGMIGIMSTLIIWLRANTITQRYYNNK